MLNRSARVLNEPMKRKKLRIKLLGISTVVVVGLLIILACCVIIFRKPFTPPSLEFVGIGPVPKGFSTWTESEDWYLASFRFTNTTGRIVHLPTHFLQEDQWKERAPTCYMTTITELGQKEMRWLAETEPTI